MYVLGGDGVYTNAHTHMHKHTGTKALVGIDYKISKLLCREPWGRLPLSPQIIPWKLVFKKEIRGI